MYVLQSTKDLVYKVSDVVIAQPLVLEKFVKVRLHECLNNVDILHVFKRCWTKDIQNVYDLSEKGQRLSPIPTLTHALIEQHQVSHFHDGNVSRF